MLKGIYTSAYGMVTKQAQQRMISNNIANINSTGFKKDQMVFKSLLQEGNRGNIMENLNDQDVEVLAVYPDFEMGPMVETNNPFDIAIQGEGFFTVNTPNGEKYTRSGNFTVNQDNMLVDMNGNYIIGINGDSIEIDGNNVSIAKDGSVIVDGEEVDKLMMVKFENSERLLKEGNTYYNLNENQMPLEMLPEEINLANGYLEGSNVNSVREMTHMIEAMRNYETNQKMIQMQDGTLDKLINEVARA